MHIAGRPKVQTKFHEATYRYGSHMGTGAHVPAYAEAWLAGDRDRAVIVEAGDMEPAQAVAKAVALLKR